MKKGMSRPGAYLCVVLIVIFIYLWSLSVPGAQAMAAPLPHSSGSVGYSNVDASSVGYLGYLSAFFIGGVSLTMVTEKNKSQGANDLLNRAK